MRNITHKRKRRKINKCCKIVFLIGELGLGGSERQLYLLLKHFDLTNFKVHVVVFNSSPNFSFDDSLINIGVKVWPIPPDKKGIAKRIYFLFLLFRRIKPDIVHSWTVHDNPYAGFVGFLAGVPVRVGSLRGSLNSAAMQKLAFIFRYLSIHSVESIVVNSDSLVAELKEQKYPLSRVYLIPNCVRLPKDENPIPPNSVDLSHFGIESHHKIVGIVGNLRRVKNHLMFVQGMHSVIVEFPSVRALIVGQTIAGETYVRDELKEKIQELKMEDKIILAGFRNDVTEMMKKFNVFCLTSNSEGTPNVILEAIAAECPVVATDVGGVNRIIENGVTGFLVAPRDLNGFIRAVKRVIYDTNLAKKIATNAKITLENRYGCKKVSNQLANFYLKLLNSQKTTV
jgi:glycosyltransferase involved in cell wall biosynthesis